MANKLFMLEIIEDNDGNYEFHHPTFHSSFEMAVCAALKDREEFKDTEWGEDYFIEDECLNVDDDEFIDSIKKSGFAVMWDTTANNRRIYKVNELAVHIGIADIIKN